MTTNKEKRERARFMAKVQDELRRREAFKIKPLVLAVRQALRQMQRS